LHAIKITKKIPRLSPRKKNQKHVRGRKERLTKSPEEQA
jgi:hypothetical protein